MIDRIIKLKLKLSERIRFQHFYPQQANILTAVLLRDIREKVDLTQAQMKSINFKILNLTTRLFM